MKYNTARFAYGSAPEPVSCDGKMHGGSKQQLKLGDETLSQRGKPYLEQQLT